MKRIAILALWIALLVIASPARAQVDCTPPVGAQLVAVNVTGQYTAWAIGNSVTWCGNGIIVSTYESTYIDTLYFDAYWLPYNLYFGYSVDGYLFQMNVSTGQGHLIRQHGQPPGDEGSAHSETQPQPEAVTINPTPEPTPTPVIRRPPVKPLVIWGFDILKLWQ